MGVRHAKVATTPADSSEVNTDDWNNAHVIEWESVSVDTAMVAGEFYLVDASGGAVDMTLPASVAAGEAFVVRAIGGNVTIVSNGNVIDGVGAGNDLLLADGETASLVASGTGALVLVSSGNVNATPPYWKTVEKEATTTRSATTSLAADPDLSFPVQSGRTYRVRAEVFYNQANATMDFKYMLALSAAFTEHYTLRSQSIPATAIGASNLFTDVASGILNAAVSITTSASGFGYLLLETCFTADANGTFEFQWAQNTSDAGVLGVYVGSKLQYHEVGA